MHTQVVATDSRTRAPLPSLIQRVEWTVTQTHCPYDPEGVCVYVSVCVRLCVYVCSSCVRACVLCLCVCAGVYACVRVCVADRDR
jgi:hypothetical protein